jgi:hypothetical protein
VLLLMCVSLGFVVLVFLEETKEWFWGYGERTKRARLSLSRLWCFFSAALLIYISCCLVMLFVHVDLLWTTGA